MIATDRQLQKAQAELEHLTRALATEQAAHEVDIAPELMEAALAGIQAQIDEIAAEIAQFEELRGDRLKCLDLHSLLDIPDVLIGARVAAGLTQADLAERIGVSPQQVQKDEAGDYVRASLERLHTVATLLKVEIQCQAQLPARGTLSRMPTQEALIRGAVTV